MANLTDDTGWQPINIDGGDGDQSASGRIELSTGHEKNPCYTCQSFVKEPTKLIQHFISRGLTAEPDGCFVTPIAKDFKGRRSLRIDPKDWGYCRKECHPTDMLATCPAYKAVAKAADLMGKI